MDKEDIDRALADFDRAVALDPRRKEIYFNRGFARRRKGDHDGALKDFDNALALDPRFASGHYGRAVVMSDTSELDRAIKEFNRAIELDPRYALAYGNRGLSLLLPGQGRRSRKGFRARRRAQPGLKAELESCVEKIKKWRQTKR